MRWPPHFSILSGVVCMAALGVACPTTLPVGAAGGEQPDGGDPGDAGNPNLDGGSPDASRLDGSRTDASFPDAARADAAGADAGVCADCFVSAPGFPVSLPNTPVRLGAVATAALGSAEARWLVLLESNTHAQATVISVTASGALTANSYPGGAAPSGPVLADVNGDGTADVVWADHGATLRVHPLGSGVAPAGWPVALGPALPGMGLATWTDAVHGRVFNVSLGANVFRVGTDGLTVSGWPNQLSQAPMPEGVATCQLNGSAAMEVAAVVQSAGQIRVLAVDDVGAFVAGFPSLTLPRMPAAPPTCADVDGNGLDEVAVLEDDGTLHLLEANGSERAGFPVNVGPGASTQVSAGDLTGDGLPELVLASRAGNQPGSLVAVAADASLLPGFPVPLDGQVSGAVLVSDVDGDGRDDLVAVTLQGSLYVVSQGAVAPGYPVSVGGIPVGTPALEDLDGDGRAELAVATATHLRVGSLRAGSGSARRPWVRYRGHDGRTSRYRGEAGGP